MVFENTVCHEFPSLLNSFRTIFDSVESKTNIPISIYFFEDKFK